MQVWHEFQSVNPSFALAPKKVETISIIEALLSSEFSSIRTAVIDIRSAYEYNSQGNTKTVTFLVIGDESGTAYLMINDFQAVTMEVEKTYLVNKIRAKKINGSSILSTTIDSNITETSNVNTLSIDVSKTL